MGVFFRQKEVEPGKIVDLRQLKTKNDKLKIKNGICALRATCFNACGGRAKIQP